MVPWWPLRLDVYAQFNQVIRVILMRRIGAPVNKRQRPGLSSFPNEILQNPSPLLMCCCCCNFRGLAFVWVAASSSLRSFARARRRYRSIDDDRDDDDWHTVAAGMDVITLYRSFFVSSFFFVFFFCRMSRAARATEPQVLVVAGFLWSLPVFLFIWLWTYR